MTTLNQTLKKKGLRPDGSPIVPPPFIKLPEKEEVREKSAWFNVEKPEKTSDPLLEIVKNPDFLRKAFRVFPQAVKSRFLEDPIPAGGQLPKIVDWIMNYLDYTIEKPYSKFHMEIYRLLATEDRVLVAAFRGSAKSRVLQKYVVWSLCNFVWRNILYISKVGPVSSNFLTKISSDLKYSEGIRKDYGNVIFPLQRDSREILQVASGGMVSALGVGDDVRGFQSLYGRPDLVIGDDFQTVLDVKSQISRDNLRDYFDQDLMKSVNTERSQVVILGNLFDRLCFAKEIADNKDNKYGDFKVYAPTAEYQDEKGERRSLWPSLWPLERLDKEKEKGWLSYQREFMNNPVDSEYAMIREGSLEWYEKLPSAKYECLIAVDPAGAKTEAGRNKSRDYSGICVLMSPLEFEKEEERNFYVSYWKRFRNPLPYVAEMVANLYFEYRRYWPTYILGEEHGIYTINDEIKRQLEMRRAINLSIIKRITRSRMTGDLEQRMSQLLGLFETGRVHFKTVHKDLAFEELLPFPNADHDDGVSALEIALTYAKKKTFTADSSQHNWGRERYKPIPGTGRLVLSR